MDGKVYHAECTIAANFVATPARESIEFLASRINFRLELRFDEIDQIMQAAVRPTLRGHPGSLIYLVILIRLRDWLTDSTFGLLEARMATLLEILRENSDHGDRRLIIVFCPSPGDSSSQKLFDAIEASFSQAFMASQEVDVITSELLMQYYPQLCSDTAGSEVRVTHTLAYSRRSYSAIGSMVVRAIYRHTCILRKVIVLDCDNTLWRGLCSDLQGGDVRVTESHRTFQSQLLQQSQRGRLLCLLSKNDAADVRRVFDSNPAMLLTNADIAAERIDWCSKAENIVNLAEELSLSLDSFVFIDDDRFECEAMRVAHPEVLTIQVPENDDELRSLLNNIWDLDLPKKTVAAENRLKYYQTNAKRSRELKDSKSMTHFLETLKLEVAFRKVSCPEDAARIVELSQRTNQFNLNGGRINGASINSRLGAVGVDIFLIAAKDRFGEYGDIGGMIIQQDSATVVVESCYISCRALGRGVEKLVGNWVIDHARSRGCKNLIYNYCPTDRNKAVSDFLEDAKNYLNVVERRDGVPVAFSVELP